jgi:hypothetical protein
MKEYHKYRIISRKHEYIKDLMRNALKNDEQVRK